MTLTRLRNVLIPVALAALIGGAALLWSAHNWWTRMEARKPTRFNVDYWKAYSALCWIEGNRSEANEAWEKSNTLAQQLPKAGEYEFDRYCCSKLRQAMDEVAAPR
jgi:hypothetical protein